MNQASVEIGKRINLPDTTERRPERKPRAFYETQVVRRVAEVLQFCWQNAAIGIVTAGFGCGKTEALRAFRSGAGRDIPTLIFEFNVYTNRTNYICDLARMMGIAVKGGPQAAFREVCEYLRKTPLLLIFDQCEMVKVNVAQSLRAIWDETNDAGVGVVLLAAPILMERLTGSRAADLGALSSRVGLWAPLAGISSAEMAAIVKREIESEVDPDAFELWYRAIGGSMRRLIRSIDLLQAKHAGKRITARTITGVAGNLWGLNLERTA